MDIENEEYEDRLRECFNDLSEDYAVSWSDGGWGYWDIEKDLIVCPEPTTLRMLHVGLHEIGHATHNHKKGGSKPVHEIEYEAEKWAVDRMAEYGFELDEVILNDICGKLIKQIELAKKNGAKNIHQESLEFTKEMVNRLVKVREENNGYT